MTAHRLFQTLDAALDVHLPTVSDEATRQEALAYHRGIKTLLATVVVPEDEDNVIQFPDRAIQRRIEQAIAEKRRTQLADARKSGEHYVSDDFGWPAYDDID